MFKKQRTSSLRQTHGVPLKKTKCPPPKYIHIYIDIYIKYSPPPKYIYIYNYAIFPLASLLKPILLKTPTGASRGAAPDGGDGREGQGRQGESGEGPLAETGLLKRNSLCNLLKHGFFNTKIKLDTTRKQGNVQVYNVGSLRKLRSCV